MNGNILYCQRKKITSHPIITMVILWKLLIILPYISNTDASPHNVNPISIGMRSVVASSSSTNVVQLFGYRGSSNISRRRFQQQKQQHRRKINYNFLDYDESRREENSVVLTNGKSNISYEESYKERQLQQLQEPTVSSLTKATHPKTRGGGKALAKPVLNFWENMFCGAVSRSVAQIMTHPANTMKTVMQSNRDVTANKMTLRQIAKPENFKMLTRGAGAQLVLSVPHGAVNFAVLEYVRRRISSMAMNSEWASKKKETSAAFGPLMDFVSSAVATICCSVVSTPQMMIVDNIMAGTYPNLMSAVTGLSAERGIIGFYTGWWPGLAGKIPSYAITWTLFQQLKRLQLKLSQRQPTDFENSMMGCVASATSVCVLIPMDTIKTRLVTQMNYPDLVPYKGIIDAAVRIYREEGIGTFYRGLPPRLISVVPMVGIQFGAYEFMNRLMLSRHHDKSRTREGEKNNDKFHRIESVIMEVAADDDQPFPAPNLRDYETNDDHRKRGLPKKK